MVQQGKVILAFLDSSLNRTADGWSDGLLKNRMEEGTGVTRLAAASKEKLTWLFPFLMLESVPFLGSIQEGPCSGPEKVDALCRWKGKFWKLGHWLLGFVLCAGRAFPFIVVSVYPEALRIMIGWTGIGSG